MLRGLLSREDDLGWRIPYILQWLWPIPLLVISYFCPESPWWLVRKGRLAEARRSLERLSSKVQMNAQDIDNTLAMMEHTIVMENEMTQGASYLDCFRGINLRRTEINLGAWSCQVGLAVRHV
jgi:SP family general alpha glucoside:H+ symporter-like MFS transporter